ncbi:hypothetical protein OH77DRAFT_1519779 [Trametes cingulata]|nr:hypothetical protein OH77DRAFT_1519779 [Trametes cingulata]
MTASVTITAPPIPTSTLPPSVANHPLLSTDVVHITAALHKELDTAEHHATFEEYLCQNDSRDLHDIQDLNRNIHNLVEIFAHLSRRFGKFDLEARLQATPARGVTPLKPQWQVLYKRFKGLLNQSRGDASKACAILSQYVNLFGNDDANPRNLSDLKVEAEHLLKLVETNEEMANGYTNGFSELAEDIGAFSDVVADTVSRQDTRVSRDLDSTLREVEDLRSRLARVKRQLSSYSLAVIACLSVGAIAAGVYMTKLSPSAVYAAAVALPTALPAAMCAKGKWDGKRELERQLFEAESKLSALHQQQAAVAEFKSSLYDTNGRLGSLAEKIGDISKIWYHIENDIRTLSANLCTAAGPEAPTTTFFLRKLKISHKIYSKLTRILSEYARGDVVKEDL